MRDACLAARHVIITAEEIVPAAVITSDPNRVIIPAFRVSAVCHAPWGAHPSPVPGFYNRDHQAFIDYRDGSKTAEAFARWQERWVDTPKSREDYLKLLGAERMSELSLRNHIFSAPADYGY